MTLFLAALLLQGGEPLSPGEAFARAEALYEDERYAEAAEVYEAIVEAGIEDPAVYYNLGNAHFKAESIGRAVLSWERARRLAPGDPDVRANLDFVNGLVTGGEDDTPLPLGVRWAVEGYRRVTPDALAGLVSVLAILSGALVTYLLTPASGMARRRAVTALVASASLTLLTGSLLAAKASAAASRVEAIVLADNAYVRSGPGEQNPRLAEVHEGLKLTVVSERGAWYQVRLADGLTGWVHGAEVETV